MPDASSNIAQRNESFLSTCLRKCPDSVVHWWFIKQNTCLVTFQTDPIDGLSHKIILLVRYSPRLWYWSTSFGSVIDHDGMMYPVCCTFYLLWFYYSNVTINQKSMPSHPRMHAMVIVLLVEFTKSTI